MDCSQLVESLIALVGADKVSDELSDIEEHSIDKWLVGYPPDAVVFAETTEDVVAVMKFSNQEGVPVTTRGSGVGYVGGAVPVKGGIVLSVARMDSIKEINVEDGVAIVGPGLITGTLQDAVRDLGWFYPPDPASLRECSIGGNVATNAGGPRCLKYGVTRNYVLGLEVVLADGTLARLGGRCHKNKTGFDLIGMFVGSEGLLGVVTEVTCRLIPYPPSRAMVSATFESFADAALAVQEVMSAGFLPAALEIADKFTLSAARDHVGSEMIPQGEAFLLVELDGQKGSVGQETDSVARLISEQKSLTIETATDESGCEDIWEIRRAFSYSLRATGLTKLNEDIVVPRGRLVELVEFCEVLQQECGMPIACFGHAGDGNIHVNIMVEDIEIEENRKRSDEALDQLFKKVLSMGGVVSGEHGIGIAKKRWFEDALDDGSLDLHRRLKSALDRESNLNPGKFV
ncbi:MAG: FAD-binding protein [Akkermansiaceae bacterium]|jgi:glycolate oxidase|nr:FAD-binding protein [Akkermansiaceae bacterium]